MRWSLYGSPALPQTPHEQNSYVEMQSSLGFGDLQEVQVVSDDSRYENGVVARGLFQVSF